MSVGPGTHCWAVLFKISAPHDSTCNPAAVCKQSVLRSSSLPYHSDFFRWMESRNLPSLKQGCPPLLGLPGVTATSAPSAALAPTVWLGSSTRLQEYTFSRVSCTYLWSSRRTSSRSGSRMALPSSDCTMAISLSLPMERARASTRVCDRGADL